MVNYVVEKTDRRLHYYVHVSIKNPSKIVIKIKDITGVQDTLSMAYKISVTIAECYEDEQDRVLTEIKKEIAKYMLNNKTKESSWQKKHK